VYDWLRLYGAVFIVQSELFTRESDCFAANHAVEIKIYETPHVYSLHVENRPVLTDAYFGIIVLMPSVVGYISAYP